MYDMFVTTTYVNVYVPYDTDRRCESAINSEKERRTSSFLINYVSIVPYCWYSVRTTFYVW